MAKTESKAEKSFRVSLIGAETMLGKDVREALESRNPGNASKTVITTYSASGEGTFGEQEGEAIYLEPFSEKSLAAERMVVLAGSEAGTRKSYGVLQSSGKQPVVIDVLGQLEDEKKGELVSTLVTEVKPKTGQLLSLAHPVASALVLILSRLSKYQAPVRAVANVLEPASERGQAGITELHKQTAALLAFKPLPREVFDAQLAFNTLSKIGEEAKVSLADIERRIHAHTLRLAAQVKAQAAVAQLSLRLVQASVFHGYSISLYVEFSAKVDRKTVEETLACAQIEVRGLGEEAPDAVASAGTSGLMAGDIRVDAANSKAVWIWIVFDNLRLLADSVADVAAVLWQEKA